MSITSVARPVALIAVDLQLGILAAARPADAARIVAATSALAEACHERGYPVVWVRALGLPPGRTERPMPDDEPPADFAEFDERLPIGPDDLVIAKRALSAFTVPELEPALASAEVSDVVVTGIATGMGVESTARGAYDAGYSVIVARDAVTDPYAVRGEHSLTHVIPGIGQVGTTAEILSALR